MRGRSSTAVAASGARFRATRQVRRPPGHSAAPRPSAVAEPPMDAVLRYGPVAAVPAALRESVHQTRQLLSMIGRAFSGRVSVRNTVSGPITIARAANAYASHGAAWY